MQKFYNTIFFGLLGLGVVFALVYGLDKEAEYYAIDQQEMMHGSIEE